MRMTDLGEALEDFTAEHYDQLGQDYIDEVDVVRNRYSKSGYLGTVN